MSTPVLDAPETKQPIIRNRPSRRAFDEQVLLAAMLVESSDDAIIGMTRSSVITTWNRAAQRVYGYAATEVIGKDIKFLLPPDRLNELEGVQERMRTATGAEHHETKRVHKDGRIVDVAIAVPPIHDLDGNLIGISARTRDITERKRTDAVAAEFAAIVDSSNDAIIGKTLDGVITTLNRGAEAVYGYTAAEMIGKSISLLVPRERPDEDREIIAGMLAEDQRTKGCGARGSPAKPSRPSLGSRRGHCAAPLASLLGFTELLYSRDFSDEKRRQYLGVMLREGRRLTDLINDVLHIQRLEAGHQTLNLAPADLDALIHRAVLAAGEDPERPIEVRVGVALPLVMVDTDAILQVLSNFLSNARKYSPDGGAIRVSTRLNGNMVEIDVQDHGLGLPEEALPKVFATFYRVETGDRRLIKGTGLGLAINRRIVEAHGGQVGAYSGGPGEGSRFQFTLPTVQESPKEADVLIIEDDTGFARMLQEQFVARGMTTVRTADAETAQRLLREGMKPRAVVTDLVLPGVQGEEFLTKLGAEADRAAVPVLVLTVKSLAPAEISALEKVGVTAVLPKEAGASLTAVSMITEALVPKVPT